MKKFFEVPVVSSVELAQEDVIMNSVIAGDNGIVIVSGFEDTEDVSETYNMWKGFKAE